MSENAPYHSSTTLPPSVPFPLSWRSISSTHCESEVPRREACSLPNATSSFSTESVSFVFIAHLRYV